ncbi:DUF423 domain-containing protein [Bacillaceae bacterium]
MKVFIILGSLNAFLSIALGAFGAHGLKSVLPPERLAVYETGVEYHMLHSLALILVAVLSDKLGNGKSLAKASGWLIFAGILLFSGSLYVLTFTGAGMWGIVTPFGGVAFLLGWLSLALAAWKTL